MEKIERAARRDRLVLAEALGFRVTNTEGSRHLLAPPGLPQFLTLQAVKCKAKPDQDEDRGDIPDNPDLRHCSAFGATPEEALAEVCKAS